MVNVLFSVIIPVYRDNRIRFCLQAVAEQTIDHNCFEVILVNNDPDNLVDIDLNSYKNLNIKVFNESIPGSYAARNNGILHAAGKILAFTDSDCVPDVNWLKNAIAVFEADLNCELGILAGDITLFYQNESKLTSAEIYEKYTGFTQKQYVKEGNCVTANWFSYRSVIQEMGGFNSRLKSNGDTELSARISKKYKIVFAPDVIVKHPARHRISELVYKHRRMLGGTHTRRFSNRPISFFWHIIEYSGRRVRFAIRKSVTLLPNESFAIWKVCVSLIIGAWREYFHLIANGETKR